MYAQIAKGTKMKYFSRIKSRKSGLISQEKSLFHESHLVAEKAALIYIYIFIFLYEMKFASLGFHLLRFGQLFSSS